MKYSVIQIHHDKKSISQLVTGSRTECAPIYREQVANKEWVFIIPTLQVKNLCEHHKLTLT